MRYKVAVVPPCMASSTIEAVTDNALKGLGSWELHTAFPVKDDVMLIFQYVTAPLKPIKKEGQLRGFDRQQPDRLLDRPLAAYPVSR